MKIGAMLLLLWASHAIADIREIEHIDAILPEIDQTTLVFLDLDETLIESPIMLGGKAWRGYITQLLKTKMNEEETEHIHDQLSYYISKRVPYIAVEETIPTLLSKLHEQSIPVFGLTARGKEHWYDMPSPDAETLTFLHLKQAGINWNSSPLLIDQALLSHCSYAYGIFFAYPIEDKGELILNLFSQTNYRPSKILFVDDKRSNVGAVDKALGELGIPAQCFHYRLIDLYRTFDPITAHIQLEKLVFEDRMLSNEEASALKAEYAGIDPDAFFLELTTQIEIIFNQTYTERDSKMGISAAPKPKPDF